MIFLALWPWVFLGMPIAFVLFAAVYRYGRWKPWPSRLIVQTRPRAWVKGSHWRRDREDWMWGAMGMALFSLILYVSYLVSQ